MQISELAKQYVSTTSSSEAMKGTRGVEKLVSSIRDLTAGNIFEGTVNSIKNGNVVLGLSNGTLLNARLDANMQLLQGQSMFFQVKSNNGETIAIRPYTVDGNGVNLTLLNALNAAGLPVTDKYLNLANNMMQEQMPIDKNTMNQMARILMANPDMSVNTLVQMKKLNIPITNEMVAQFENYVDDSSAVHKALDSFITELPTTMAGKDMPLEQLKAFDSQLLQIIADGMEGQSGASSQVAGNTNAVGEMAQQIVQDGASQTLQQTAPQEGASQQTIVQDTLAQDGANQQAAVQDATAQAGGAEATAQEGAVQQTVAEEKAMAQEENVQQTNATQDTEVNTQTTTKENVLRLMHGLFGETGITAEDSPAVLLNKLSHVILTGDNISKDALNQLFSSKDMQQFLRDALEGQMYLTPEEVADGEKVKKLYERLESKTQRLENLLNQAGLQNTPLAQTVAEVRGNVEFMNQLNQAYTFVQIPLKMAGQNASGQLYVYTNKRDMSDPEKELTAFLHLDLDHLGSTDVSVKMLHKKVDTKFYMDTDEAFELVKAHMPELEERLRRKGFDAKIYVENEGKKVNFLDDFLKKDAPPTGQLHRYSFDVRA
ncbi:MAG: flagellar hook-length control protein FliK [Agathobacter sp.]|nr:flagellar hook-length control protein FliK [Agathobacter sp.]